MALVFIASPTNAAKRNQAVQPVSTVRVPNGGIQPQIAIDDQGVLHMVYFSGEAAHGDLYYVRSGDGGATFSVPIKVNSHPGSAIATGNIRGAHRCHWHDMDGCMSPGTALTSLIVPKPTSPG